MCRCIMGYVCVHRWILGNVYAQVYNGIRVCTCTYVDTYILGCVCVHTYVTVTRIQRCFTVVEFKSPVDSSTVPRQSRWSS